MSPLASDGAGTAFTSFSTIISVISALIGILGCLYATLFCCSHLPDARIRRLDELLRETEVYCRAREDKDLQAELSVIRREACGLRYRAHRAVAHWQQWAEFFKGLSFEIEYSCYKARALRARMIDLLQGENGIVIDVHDGVELNDLPRKTISWPAPDKGVRSMQTARPMSDRAGQLQLRWWTRMGASRTADAYLHNSSTSPHPRARGGRSHYEGVPYGAGSASDMHAHNAVLAQIVAAMENDARTEVRREDFAFLPSRFSPFSRDRVPWPHFSDFTEVGTPSGSVSSDFSAGFIDSDDEEEEELEKIPSNTNSLGLY